MTRRNHLLISIDTQILKSLQEFYPKNTIGKVILQIILKYQNIL